MTKSMLWAVIGLAAAFFTSTSFIPQLILRLRSPQQARMSYSTLAAFLAGACLWTAYGVHLQDTIIILANLVVVATLIAITLVQWIQDRNLKS